MFTLGKNERLKSRKLIDRLFREGKSLNAHPVKVLFIISEVPGSLQAGFTVSTKNFKKAVDRNRLKRLMREAYRLQKNELTREDRHTILFFIYIGKEVTDFETMNAKMKELTIKLVGKLNESAS